MNKIIIKIKRSDSNHNSYCQEFEYDGDMNIPVTTLLEKINQQEVKTVNGENISPITFSCSCLQGLCGSCAMIINDVPQLACKAFLNDVVANNQIVIEPLSKFPIISDLKIDRSSIYETTKDMQIWLEDNAKINNKNIPFEYKMSLCLMCGCCLEACPNFVVHSDYIGIPQVVSSIKILNQETNNKHIKHVKENYKTRFYPNCVKSLLCQDVCPMEIPTQTAISKMNKYSVWWFWQLFGK